MAAFFFAAFFLAGAFFAAFFLAGAFFAAFFLAGAFLAAFFFAGAFLAAFFFAAMAVSFLVGYYFLGLSVALSVELAVNFMRVDAEALRISPVRGLRTIRAGRLRVENEPKPGHATLSPFLVAFTT